MLLNLLSFLAETKPENKNGWVTWVFLGVVVVLMVVLLIVPQRKQKKQREQMVAKLKVGSSITTIGGIIGTVLDINETNGDMVIETGIDGSKTTMKVVKGALYQVNPDVSEINKEGELPKQEDTVDEIK
ncbi:MAG: preprotein translocase subunit YajC [Clostridia bacterium]